MAAKKAKSSMKAKASIKTKAGYADGFLIPVKRSKISAYKKIASIAAKVWKDHGALDYKECAGDDLKVPGVVSFLKPAKAKQDETVIIAWITYRSKKHRDSVNKKVMSDPRIAAVSSESVKKVFDSNRLVYGGFKIIVD